MWPMWPSVLRIDSTWPEMDSTFSFVAPIEENRGVSYGFGEEILHTPQEAVTPKRETHLRKP